MQSDYSISSQARLFGVLPFTKMTSAVMTIVTAVLLFLVYQMMFRTADAFVLGWRVYDFGQPLFSPEGRTFAFWMALVFTLDYVIMAFGIVTAGEEGIVLHMHKFTGVSFESGMYLLFKYPIPFANLWFQLKGEENTLGYHMRKDVSIERHTIDTSFTVRTTDGIELNVGAQLLVRFADQAGVEAFGPKSFSHLGEVYGQFMARAVAFGDTAMTCQEFFERRESFLEEFYDEYEPEETFGIEVLSAVIQKIDFANEKVKELFDNLKTEDLRMEDTIKRAEQIRRLREVLGKDFDANAVLSIYAASRGESFTGGSFNINLK